MTSIMDVDEDTSQIDLCTASMDSDVHSPPTPDLQMWQDELRGNFANEAADASQVSIQTYEPRYPARIATTFITTTWIGQDESGTYDPDSERGPSPLPCNRKRRERPDHSDHARPKRARNNTLQHGRFYGCQMILTFKISSKHGLAWQKAAGTTSDNWPPVVKRQTTWLSSGNESSSEDVLNSKIPYGPQKRSPRGLLDHAYFDRCEAPDLADITLGHPAARGCKACFATDQKCSLLDEIPKYPCTNCQEDDIDCDLVMEPSVKRACEPCGRRRAVCSYREPGSDHAKPCIPCRTAGIECIAGPLSVRIRVVPSIEQAWPGEKEGCHQCARGRKLGASREKTPPFSYNLCCQDEQECSFEPERRQAAILNFNSKRKAAASRKSKAMMRTEVEHFKTVTTKLAHPSFFNYTSVDDPDPMSCPWCVNAVYGLLGLGEADVEIVDSGDRQRNTEVVDGHTVTGVSQSRMCTICTLDRFRIMACEVHEMGAIDEMDPQQFDYSSIAQWMTLGAASTAPFPWCSICPAPAFFACCAEVDAITALDEDIGKGCGLLLCESCAVTLGNEHNGNLEGLIDQLVGAEADGGVRLRADVDFLHPKGELTRRMGGG